MEESDKDENEVKTEEETENTEKVKKKHKKRQKKTLADLQKQIEFYFSEPNLQKDRFLRQRIEDSDNGCVEIETIASFNRMKQLCAGDISLIVKAMKRCPTVEVIDDKWVKPSQPLPEPKNVDSVTVYVERLPSHADHNWIKSLFSACGNVVYVSLPRYKTRDIKGFAFVEFEKESEAEAALKMFAEKSSKEGDETEIENKMENDEELTSKREKKSKKRKAKLSESENEEMKGRNKKSKHKREDGVESVQVSKKTKRTIEKEICEESGQKRAKRENEKVDELSGSDDISEETKSKKRKRKISEENEDGGTSSKKKHKESEESDGTCEKSKEAGNEDDITDVGDDDKKKKRKRKKKEKQEVEVPQLRVISKTEWLALKKEYQKLQRQAMNDAKQKLKIEFEAKTEQEPETNGKNQEDEQVKEDKTECLEDHEETDDKKKKKELPQKLEMEPGVVLKVSSDENIDKRQLRNAFSMIAPIAYLDVGDDSNVGHVRFATKQACDKIVETFSMENIKIEKLTEKEDAEYWERLNNDRLERFQQGKKRNKRGRQKITKKIDERNAKKRDHIHFED